MKINDSILASFTHTRPCDALAKQYGRKTALITVKAEAYRLGGNAHPHFSVTAEIYTPGRSHDPFCCGCMHDEVLRFWPELRPLVDLHLSNADDGEPMHGESNGFYWLAGALGGLGEKYHGGSGSSGKSPDECLQIFADHCRITTDEAKGICESVAHAFTEGSRSVSVAEDVSPATKEHQAKEGRKLAKEEWSRIYSGMLPRFKAEAESGLALIRTLASQTQNK